MGLDMYLNAKRYLGIADFKTMKRDEPSPTITAMFPELQGQYQAQKVEVQVAYWRKANAIHRWFVENVQGGKDECQESYVDDAQLRALLDAAKQALAVPANASEVLPTQEGFFFGTTDYDKWYIEDLENTVKQLSEILDNEGLMKDWEFYYQSSW